jgi:hypothetical protein
MHMYSLVNVSLSWADFSTEINFLLLKISFVSVLNLIVSICWSIVHVNVNQLTYQQN